MSRENMARVENRKGRVMIVGLGNVGGYVLELLARTYCVREIIVCSRNKEWGEKKVNNAFVGSLLQGFYPHITFRYMDITDVDMTAYILRETKPDIIFNATAISSVQMANYKVTLLEKGGAAPWMCWLLPLLGNLMKAVRKSGITTYVVNASYPDGVNPTLAKLNLAPTTGCGNIHHLIPRIKKSVNVLTGVDIQDISVFLVGGHYIDNAVSINGNTGGAPCFLKVIVKGEDITQKIGADNILSRCNISIPSGKKHNYMVASSAVRMITSLLKKEPTQIHAPGPLGLIGGYPVVVSSDSIKVDLPAEVSLEEAIRINKESMKFDGIETIKDDGTVIFTQRVYETVKRQLGYDYKELKVGEWEWRARDLVEIMRSRFGKW